MTKQEMLIFVNQYYNCPVCKHWQPSDYQMKHHYNTPRRLKRLESDRIKEDAKLQIIYERELQCYNNVLNIIDDIDVLPDRLKDLFYTTLQNQVLYDIKTRENFKEKDNNFKELYGQDDRMNGFHSAYSEAKCLYDCYINRWNETNIHYWKKQIFNFDNINFKDFSKICNEWLKMKKLAEQTLSPQDGLIHGSYKIREIIDCIKKTLGGNPDKCDYDAHWGLNNEFNAVVGRNSLKASFKSFLAGGWNIQRLHIRYRITLLKN